MIKRSQLALEESIRRESDAKAIGTILPWLHPKPFADRRLGLGGTDVAAILGVHPYRRPIDVWGSKILGEEVPDNPAMEWGRRLEDPIREAYQDAEEVELLVPSGTFQDTRSTVRWASPDALVVAPWVYGHPVDPRRILRGLEIKSAGWRQADRYGPEGSDDIPAEYLVQVLWYLGATDLPRWDLAALILPGRDFRRYVVEADPDLLAEMESRAADWWTRHVVADEPPPPDGSASWKGFARRRWPKDKVELRQVEDDEAALVARLALARARVEDAKAEAELAAQEVQAAIGEAAGIEAPGVKATWKASKDRTRVDWKAVAEDLAGSAEFLNLEMGATVLQDAVGRHSTTSPGSRVLRVKVSDERLAEES